MSQFLGFAIFLIVANGLVLHAGLELPAFLEWVGKLPGDLIIKKEGMVIYVPLTSSALISAAISVLFSALFNKKE